MLGTIVTGTELCSQLSEEVLYNLRVNALWHHSILSDNVADNVAPEQSSAPVISLSRSPILMKSVHVHCTCISEKAVSRHSSPGCTKRVDSTGVVDIKISHFLHFYLRPAATQI